MQRTKTDVTEETKKLSNNLIKELYKDYKQTPHREHTTEEAYANVDAMTQISMLIQRLIESRNATFI